MTNREFDSPCMIFEQCPVCKERLYSQEVVRRFEQIRAKLERQETEEFRARRYSALERAENGCHLRQLLHHLPKQ